MRKDYSVVIVDDHLLFAQALQNLLSSFCNCRVLYHAKNGKEFIDRLRHRENIPDIALIDIKMPVMNGIETTEWLTRNIPEVNTLGLSMDDEEETIIKMVRAGAKGYLLKDIDPSVLEDAFRDVMDKGYYYSDLITSTMFNSLHKSSEPSHQLRDREIEFLKLVCTEKTYKEIASEMFLSPKTIDGYRESLFEKLQIKSRVGLAVFAIKNKIYTIQ
jgi:DNA-binding NarL/FixJ family response regulator